MSLKTFEQGAVVTASGNSTIAPQLDYSLPETLLNSPNWISILVAASAVGGTTPSLTIEVQWSNDGVTWASASTPDTFTAITANGNVVKQVQIKGQFARLKYTVTGTTPTFTLNVTAYTA